VSERTRVVNLGNLGSFTLPLASSSVNETDTVVRVADGVTVAVGGLMSQIQSDGDARVPGAGDVPVVGNLFKRTQRSLAKRELVFLLKPTVVRGDEQWRADVAATAERMRAIQPRPQRMPLPAIDPGAAPPAAAPDRPQP
jgi:MSHA biogenesis protein MshL